MSEVILKTKDLTKKYGNRAVVDNLNIEIRRGEIFGLLEPNGAGNLSDKWGYLHSMFSKLYNYEKINN